MPLKALCLYYGDLSNSMICRWTFVFTRPLGGLWSRDPWTSWLHYIQLDSSLMMFLEETRFNSTHPILFSPETSWDLSPVEYIVVIWSMGLEITRPWFPTWLPQSTVTPYYYCITYYHLKLKLPIAIMFYSLHR